MWSSGFITFKGLQFENVATTYCVLGTYYISENMLCIYLSNDLYEVDISIPISHTGKQVRLYMGC